LSIKFFVIHRENVSFQAVFHNKPGRALKLRLPDF